MDLPAVKPNIRGPVRLLDNVLEQALCSVAREMVILLRTRRIGLRLTVLADALVVLSAPYERAGGRVFAAEILKAMRDSAYAASIAPSARDVRASQPSEDTQPPATR
jgi:ribonucleotide reductase alpha subunit